MNLDARAASLLGLLRPADTKVELQGSCTETTQRGHWKVEVFPTGVRYSCLCGRSEPILVTSSQHSFVSMPRHGLQACEVCRAESWDASCKTQRLIAWIEQHRLTLDETQHLELPMEFKGAKTPLRERLSRTRKVVYETFWRKPVTPDDYVHLKCNNPLCINPYHLCLTNNPGAKLPNKALKEVQALLSLGLSSRGIQAHLQEQHSIKLSLRSIQRIRSGECKLKKLGTS